MSKHNELVQLAPDLAAPVFFALGDATRLELLQKLGTGGPGSITQLSAGSKVSRQSISKHLSVLADAGLVRGTRKGREHLWELETARLAEAQAYLEKISLLWDDALNRLKQFVER